MEMDLMEPQHQLIFYPSARFTKSEIKPDKNYLHFLLHDFET
jgi:predicted nucleotide-binding protein (sugar kinase/HSP70/actin superfamily)